MKIFNYAPNINNQNKLKRQSILAKQSSRQVVINFHYAPNVYYSPAQIAFGALKKHDFVGIDLAVVEKFKAPIEKFNSTEDFQDWAEIQANEIANKDFGGRQEATTIQRKAMIREWSIYVLDENDAYNNAMALLILNAITKDLKPDNDKLPPVLNKGVLADCMSEIDKNTKENRKYQFDLNKMYQTKLRELYLEDTKIDGGNTSWVKILSQKNDPKNFGENVEKLKTLSHQNWCTKSFNAEPYLSEGDFHVYLENGQPKLGVRFIGDKIQEIQGELNNGEIPIAYFEEVQKHINENNFKLTANANNEIQQAEEIKKEIEEIKNDLKSAIEDKDVKTIFEYFNICVEETPLGLFRISEYKQPSGAFSFSDIGIDENMLFEKVKEIIEDADFENSKITNLGNLESIGWDANFKNSKIKNLGNLKSIGWDANFSYSQVTNLNNLESIGKDADFSYSQVANLGNLKSIGRNADFRDSQITNLDNLKSIGKDADFRNSQVRYLGNLKTIGGDANFQNSQVICLGYLKTIGGFADFRSSQITNLGNLEIIGENADFYNSQVTNLGNLKKIRGYANFRTSQVTTLGNLKSIGSWANFSSSQLKDLGKLKSIGGDANFSNTQLSNLGQLETIGSNADFRNSQLTSLGNLELIGGSADFRDSQLTSLGNLEAICGNADFRNSQVRDLGNLKTIGMSVFITDSLLTPKDFENIMLA